MSQSELPRAIDFIFPALEALRELGGSARRHEVISAVAIREGLTDAQLEARYPASGDLIAADRISWALTDLKKMGAVENSSRGVWAITETGRGIETQSEIDIQLRAVRAELATRSVQRNLNEQADADGSLVVRAIRTG